MTPKKSEIPIENRMKSADEDIDNFFNYKLNENMQGGEK